MTGKIDEADELDRLLKSFPAGEPSPNFTRKVMATIADFEARKEHQKARSPFWRLLMQLTLPGLAPRAGAGFAGAGLAGGGGRGGAIAMDAWESWRAVTYINLVTAGAIAFSIFYLASLLLPNATGPDYMNVAGRVMGGFADLLITPFARGLDYATMLFKWLQL